MGIGAFLKGRREELGLSLRKVADLVRADVSYLSRVEGGKNPPSPSVLSRLSQVLSVPEQELMLMAGRVPPKVAEQASVARSVSSRVLSALNSVVNDVGSVILVERGEAAIERDFPCEQVSRVAEAESWRKEIYRPVYHMHKWWAQRLGSVFRAILIGSLAPAGSNIFELMYQPVRFPGRVVFDPFMGSGTTVGEAVKLGCRAIGRDINPVAWRLVRSALQTVTRDRIDATFARMERDVSPQIAKFYVGRDSEGRECRVLYYFWVKIANCSHCQNQIDLFSSYVFAAHAYARSNPTVRVVCSRCGHVFAADHKQSNVRCSRCDNVFNPHEGPVRGSKVACPYCGSSAAIVDLARRQGHPFDHRLYAKLVLRGDGSKQYLAATEFDVKLFEKACSAYEATRPKVPRVPILDGHNTRQILNYGYRFWHELFNKRQLLCLSLIGEAVRQIDDGPTRDAFLMLFSSTLEFNNMFVSYKGEGTGAVRHMFSHHVLKPERTPIEPNTWGTEKSSGAFSTLYRSRLLRALDYKDMPFEVKVDGAATKKASKVFGLTDSLHASLANSYEDMATSKTAWVSCGSSSHTELPDKCVDAIVTDPPFFDNVHYSELADFFFVWQQIYSSDDVSLSTTRHEEEVQDVDATRFAIKFAAVLSECHRVLKDEGLLVFTYHHSKQSGWKAVASALGKANFEIVAAHPVKSEMSVAQPKLQAKEPIDIDTILVCRKRKELSAQPPLDVVMGRAFRAAGKQIARFNGTGKALSRNDVKVVFLSNVLVQLSGTTGHIETLEGVLDSGHTRHFCEALFLDQVPAESDVSETDDGNGQMTLF